MDKKVFKESIHILRKIENLTSAFKYWDSKAVTIIYQSTNHQIPINE